MKLHWRTASSAPCEMERFVDAAVNDDTVYIKPGVSQTLFSFNLTTEKWSQLPNCPTEYCSIAVVNNFLTTIGGDLNESNTNCLFSLIEEGDNIRWEEIFPPMPTKRSNTRAVCEETQLIVGGGIDSTSRTIEVMNTITYQWSRIADIPNMFLDSLVICGEYLYSIDEDGELFKCLIRELIQSTHSEGNRIWSEVECTGSLWDSTFISMHGQLLSIGGDDPNDEPSSAVRMFSPTTKKWEDIGNMEIPRSRCLASVHSASNILIVMGGYTDSRQTSCATCTSEVEIAAAIVLTDSDHDTVH